MAELSRTATPVSTTELPRVLARAYVRLVGELPPRDLLATACAIIGLENARGKAILHHNFGNIAWVGQTQHWWMHPKPDDVSPKRFAAYPDQATGAAAWWRLMLRKYRPVLLAGARGNPAEAVRQLYALGYVVAVSPGEEAGYRKAVVSMFDEARDKWLPASRVYADPLGALALVASAAGVAVVAWPLVRRFFS